MEQWEYKVKVYDNQADEIDLNTEAADGWEVAFMAVESAEAVGHGLMRPHARVHILLKRRKP